MEEEFSNTIHHEIFSFLLSEVRHLVDLDDSENSISLIEAMIYNLEIALFALNLFSSSKLNGFPYSPLVPKFKYIS